MPAMCASRHEDFASNGAVSPHVCDPMVVPYCWRCLVGGTPRGQQGTPALTLPPMRDGLSVLLIAVLWPFRRTSMWYPVHGQLLRNERLYLTTIVPATACH